MGSLVLRLGRKFLQLFLWFLKYNRTVEGYTYSYRILKGSQLRIKCIYCHGLSCLKETKMLPGEFPFQGCKQLVMSELYLCLKDTIHSPSFPAPVPNMAVWCWNVAQEPLKKTNRFLGWHSLLGIRRLSLNGPACVCKRSKSYLFSSWDDDCFKEPFSFLTKKFIVRQISSFTAVLWNPEKWCVQIKSRRFIGMKEIFGLHPSF